MTIPAPRGRLHRESVMVRSGEANNCALDDSQVSANDVLQYRGFAAGLRADDNDLRKIYGISDLER